MKRFSYWYLYRFGDKDCAQRELVCYGTESQVSAFALRCFYSDYNMYKCSKAVACSLSHDVGLPIYNVSNLEDKNEAE